MTLTSDVYTYLAANGQGTYLFTGRLPDAPAVPADATVAAIFQYAGRPPTSVHDRAGIARERPGLQIQVRAKAYLDAETRSYQIFALLQRANATVGSGFYQQIEPMASPFVLDRDLSDRTIFAANYLCSREVA